MGQGKTPKTKEDFRKLCQENRIEISCRDNIHQVERQALLSRLLDAVKQCQVRFGGRSELATDSDSRVSCLCAAWEATLHHGLRKNNSPLSTLKQMTEKAGLGKVTDLFSDIKKLETEPVFWSYIKEHLTKHESQRFLKLKLVNTDCGRGRAWLRASLNEHSLERYMHMLIESDEMLGQYYEDWAFLRDGERNSMLPNMAAGLGSILFAITVDRPELNKGLSVVNSIHVQNNTEPSPDVAEEAEEPKPVISSQVSPASNKKRDKKKKKKLPNVVSFDDDDTVGTVITRTGSTSSAGAVGVAVSQYPEPSTVALSLVGEPRESGEGANDDENVFSGDSQVTTFELTKYISTPGDESLSTAHATHKGEGEEEYDRDGTVRQTSFPAMLSVYNNSSPSPVPSTSSDHISKSSVSSSTDLDQDCSTVMAPVGVDGLVVDSDYVALNAEGLPVESRQHSLPIGADYVDQGEIHNASLGLKLAQQGTLYSDITSTPGSVRTSPDEMSQKDLKQAVVHMMLRKESVEEQSKKLEGMLQQEMDVSSTLRAELEDLKIHYSTQHEKDTAKIIALQKENDLLKHQLKKYVSAVQMLRTESSSGKDDLGIHVEEPQPSMPPAKPLIDYSHEASEYEKKLIQVAEMHGELMEFNEMLHRQIKNKDALLRQLREELIQLRGPLHHRSMRGISEHLKSQPKILLPHDRRVSNVDGYTQDMDCFILQNTLINIWIPSAFLRGSANKAHHVYQVFIRIRDQEWNVYRRYSQFHDMHQRLRKVYPIIGKFDFPPKKTIGRKDAKLVESRRKAFQSYLRNVINVMLDKNENLADNASKDRLISFLPFFNDKTDEEKRAKRGTNTGGGAGASAHGAVGRGGGQQRSQPVFR